MLEVFEAAKSSRHQVFISPALAQAVAVRGGLVGGTIMHSDGGTQGGFNWSSQHGVVSLSVVGRQAL
ncbi:MAG TPA: hypothetical protein VI029_05975, partial [Mycobacterium sp.]